MNFKCRFSSDCSDCFRSCSNCLFFKKCKFCVHSSECDRRNTDKSCQFDDPLIKALMFQEEVIKNESRLCFVCKKLSKAVEELSRVPLDSFDVGCGFSFCSSSCCSFAGKCDYCIFSSDCSSFKAGGDCSSYYTGIVVSEEDLPF